MDHQDRPISIAMVALGGQGGGVLTGWLVETAEKNGYIAQSTYVAGVAQRTGSTVYCVEMFPRKEADKTGKVPVFTPYPIPGDVDLVIAGEMAETSRAIEKGFVTPNVSTLIASSHRVYSMPEKEALGDGIMDMSKVSEVASRAARKYVCFDMQEAADETGSIISSVIFGAIAASGALPFGRTDFEQTIRNGGKAVDSNLRGFSAGYERALSAPIAEDTGAPVEAVTEGPNGQALADRIKSELPVELHKTVLHGALRTLDYQHADYAHQYIDRIVQLTSTDHIKYGFVLSEEVARQLALQMCYEDIIRVADLKTRANRFNSIRAQVNSEGEQPVGVVEYFHPRLEEVCDILPASVGAKILSSDLLKRLISPFFSKGRNITTTKVFGFLILYLLAKWRRFRPMSYRFREQNKFIETWLDRVTNAAVKDYDYGVAVARCIEIVKGYGETYERGLSRYLAMIDVETGAKNSDEVRQLYRAALADEKGEAFEAAFASLGIDA
ncbi:MAG: indolepyruvate oxidoreductase subunit B [Woeseia sp.]|nr:indolepyruvate oxidoreductase subunit B [Woeseia sp.]